jgi:multiple sugar transport system ATP-binding protein
MAFIDVRDLRKRYGRKSALQGLSFSVEGGELFCLLGPPGAGKTTTLRLIAGLEQPDDGEILIDGQDVQDVPPQHRDVAMVFEDMALYPHMTGFGNIAHALYLRKVRQAEVRRRAAEVAALLHVEHLMDRQPHTYSGGERRRVAVARALARRPKVLLLDQALSGLDAKIRQEMTGELKALQQQSDQTMIYATHDFEEGAAMADRCLVMRDGRGIQVADPQTLYTSPDNPFVGSMIGSPAMNLIGCRTEYRDGSTYFVHSDFCFDLPVELESGRHVVVGIRPEHLQVTGDEGMFRATVEVVQTRGLEQIVDLRVGPELHVKAVVPADTGLQLGQIVGLCTSAELVHVFDGNSEQRLLPADDAPTGRRGELISDIE